MNSSHKHRLYVIPSCASTLPHCSGTVLSVKTCGVMTRAKCENYTPLSCPHLESKRWSQAPKSIIPLSQLWFLSCARTACIGREKPKQGGLCHTHSYLNPQICRIMKNIIKYIIKEVFQLPSVKKGIFSSRQKNWRHSLHTSVSKAREVSRLIFFFFFLHNGKYIFPPAFEASQYKRENHGLLMKCTWQHLQRSPEAWAGI